MCGRYVSPDSAAIERAWQVSAATPFARRWNAHPDSLVPLLRNSRDGSLRLMEATWRFVPSWWSRPTLPKETHIARLEEAADKPMWRDALRRNRCLMPALGWYEWSERPTPSSSTKQPFHVRRRDGELLAFAAVYAWRRTESEATPELRCALLTTEADARLSAVHHRMPVVLPPELHSAWLDRSRDDGHEAIELARSAISSAELEWWPISRRINDVRNDDETLATPAQDEPPAAQPSLF